MKNVTSKLNEKAIEIITKGLEVMKKAGIKSLSDANLDTKTASKIETAIEKGE